MPAAQMPGAGLEVLFDEADVPPPEGERHNGRDPEGAPTEKIFRPGCRHDHHDFPLGDGEGAQGGRIGGAPRSMLIDPEQSRLSTLGSRVRASMSHRFPAMARVSAAWGACCASKPLGVYLASRSASRCDRIATGACRNCGAGPGERDHGDPNRSRPRWIRHVK